jgi:hypothetical protein
MIDALIVGFIGGLTLWLVAIACSLINDEIGNYDNE